MYKLKMELSGAKGAMKGHSQNSNPSRPTSRPTKSLQELGELEGVDKGQTSIQEAIYGTVPTVAVGETSGSSSLQYALGNQTQKKKTGHSLELDLQTYETRLKKWKMEHLIK